MVKIIADSTCDLSKDLLGKYDISIVPLYIELEDKEYKDGIDITPDEIFDWSDQHKTTPKTAAVSLELAEQALRPYAEENRETVIFTISEDMSSTANVMRMAARNLNAEHLFTVVDSENLSTGIGLLVIQAAIWAKEGKSGREIGAAIAGIIPFVCASFVVDTLTYLYRGGRCNAVSAMAGSVLKLHPKIVVENGRMRPDKKYRGNLERVVLSYVKEMEPDLKNAVPDRVFITHSGCSREIVGSVREYLESLHRFEEIIETRAGGVISSHCGPGTLGVLFIAKA